MAYPSKQTVQSLAHSAQKAAAIQRKETKKLSVKPRLRKAIEAMVFDGLTRPEAAVIAGMTDHGVRTALTKPHVLAYLNECQEMLRTSARPRALNRVISLVDKADSDRVRLDAAKYIDGMDRGAHQVGATQVNVQVNNTVSVTPGYVIRIDRSKDERRQQIEHLDVDDAIPLSSLGDVTDDD
ncbi:hypothetical protein [Rhizobium rhizogenes]|uniref:hypothetical protein n=1 Tax=Rhizobium rhizogenes TaxID=359 RepID=UPI001573BCE4|nr:hypothetical protein [Rhizobium rhizogenes]NTG94244.1 hypothetical protein [Rhizobium rhizogenes]